ncbi:MAG: hypothetical protein KAH25_13225, partial [Bacteroidales bacterium]|nr:hypothetical protein [Bacteroidales bacterium]
NTGRLSATNPAVQCQPGYSKVLTSEGYKSIDEINLLVFGGAEVKVLTAKGNYKKVLSVFDNGVKPIYEIKTKMGNTIHCTGNHPILTSTGYILADSLELGYTVYRYTYFTGQYAKILRFIRTSISRFKSFIQGHTS